MLVLAGVPVAITTSPSMITKPLDVLLGLAIPIHAHIGMNYIITDYVPRSGRGMARGGMLAATVLATLGLLKLNIEGAGLTETLKATWRQPTAETSEEREGGKTT
ncbi:unnamed protein product [Choristocarpus tenellus]